MSKYQSKYTGAQVDEAIEKVLEKSTPNLPAAEVGQTIRVKEVDENGKPTKWEAVDLQERTHWEEEAELFSGTFDAEILVNDGVPVDFTLTDGKTYTVMWNGVEYSCPVRYMPSDNGTNLLALGNVDLALGTGDTGEPFLMINIAGLLIDLAISEYTTVELSITGHKVNVIPSQYLTNAMPYYVEIIDEDGAGNFITTETPENLLAQYSAGRSISARIIGGFSHFITPLSQIDVAAGDVIFSGQQKAISSNEIADYIIVMSVTDGVYRVTVG